MSETESAKMKVQSNLKTKQTSKQKPVVSLKTSGASCVCPENLETGLGRNNDIHERWEMNE